MYLAIFFWGMDDTSSWSVEVDTTDKNKVIQALLKHGNHRSLDDAHILVVANGDTTTSGRSFALNTKQDAPKVIAHWSALNGDFEGIKTNKKTFKVSV